ncbi:putative alpha-1,2-galactosyltransferase [Cocos nucifera]|uniref:Putative alpha-1,2-galactosyltransferase n=1 Tax=Cocos nucifera TaxID=13894 RepID=A0A8K0N8I9_COCNU|nr:putative alpha-1,2-galactosyltransferase [Cocos nucifera]
MAPRSPVRWTKSRAPNRRLWLFLSLPLLALASLQAAAAILRRANALGRRCAPAVAEYSGGSPPPPRPRIAMVSFSAEENGGGGGGRRSFRGVMDAVGGNKRAYAERMGYDFIDARRLVDPSRPPNWSKILAVRSHLHHYDWLFWNDADTVVTNPDISLV